jgi:ParB family chromosome partitioning protein
MFMYSEISIQLLKIHPKNTDYFSELPDEKYQEIKQSIAAHGIRDPLKVLSDYIVIAGHQRLRIAKELGIEKVPVVVLDISAEEAEYLLIADNEERRQGDDNPMRKARRAEYLKQYWNVREGSTNPKGTTVPRKGHNVPYGKTLADVAEAIGETEKGVKRLLKLNDLIAPLQALVSADKLTPTAAHIPWPFCRKRSKRNCSVSWVIPVSAGFP